MQTLLPFEQIDDPQNALAGFRLQRLEVWNWGTFDQRPWVLDLQGGIALLTGANGSGKSTLVDGLLTLLVPNKRRNYNQASSTSGKKEREEKSYVQGFHGGTDREESYGSKPKILREKETLSVLLAYFSDRITRQDITLAQVLWMEDGVVRKFFVIANTELTITAHFQGTRIAELKKHLKLIGATTFEEFSKYSQQLRKQLGLQSEKALDLFNQTVSIKEISGLNSFVRDHMLEKVDMQIKIRELQESYENLVVSHAAIHKARKQLEALIPLADESGKYVKLKNEVTVLQQFKEIIPAFFASKKLNLLIQELQKIEQQLTQSQHQRSESDRLLVNLRQKEKDLEFNIKQDSVGQQLQELTREIKQCQEEVSLKKKQTEEYDRLAQCLDISLYSDRSSFYSSRTKGEAIKQEINTALQELETQRDAQKLQYGELNKQAKKLEEELSSLRSRQSQIPKTNLDIRNRLIHELNLNDTDLPFVGELLQVRPEAKEWEGAIERLLRSFGLSILVPEIHYQAVNAYVNQTNLRGRLVYYRVTSTTANPTQRPLNPQEIPYKLEIKQENQVFSQWLRDRLVQQYNYVCCDTIDQLQHETKAITRTGLTKQNGERHEKDDHSKIDDRSRYILGWNNVGKIKALETEFQQINRKLTELDKQIQLLERQQKQRRTQGSWLQDFLKFIDFSDIDWRTRELDRLELQKQQRQLEASSDQLKQLKVQLETTKAEISQAEQQRDQLIQDIRTLEDRQYNDKREQSNCEIKSQLFTVTQTESFEKRMAAQLKQYSITLETITQDEANMRDSLQQELQRREQQKTTSHNIIERNISNFKRDFPETTLELGITVDCLDEYLKLKSQIEYDDLPRHEERFRRLMTGKIIEAIVGFKGQLENQEEEIEQAIDDINQSLQQIDYTSSTYIKLCCDRTRNQKIRDFKETLKICLGDVARQSAEDNEERFQNIQTQLINRFKSEEQWTTFVADVRNWLDFSVSERYRSDDKEKEHYTDSSGKSGGEKAKLAYTILASAIAYQFGLNQDTLKHKSFRFVVIDEAFSKLDDGNARYVMELFKSLNLQLLFVTPKDKINLVEPYISSLHLVSNTREENYSSIASISIEEYRHKRQLNLKLARD